MKGDPSEINSNSNKRKFKHENSDLPVPKHTCLDNNIQSRYNQGSGKDSNSLSEDADSVMSVSNDELQYLKISPYDHQNTNANATSSVNWSGTGTSTSDNSFDTKTSPAYDFYDSPTFDDHTSEFNTSEYTKQLQDEASLENLLCSTGVVSNNFVLSSGRWNVNQDTEQGTEKLTIDKEFEQYFSTLML